MIAEKKLRWIAGRLPVPLITALRYPREHLFVNGLVNFHKPRESIIFFTVKKCASTLMRRMLSEANRRHLGLTHLNLAGYFWDTRSEPFYEYLQQHAAGLLRDQGILYGPLRQYADVSHLSHARVIGMLRDPRDVVVSGYFSAGYSHRQPANRQRQQRFQDHRADVRQTDIDAYAIDYASRLRGIYARYQRHLPRSQVLTYEEMWNDFNGWLKRFAELLGTQFTPTDALRYRRMAGIDESREEDSLSHRRRGVPGDFRNKLSPDAAGKITDMFSDSLRWLYD